MFSAGVAIILEFLKYEAIVQKARNKPKEQGTNPPLLFRLISQHLDKLIYRLKPKDKVTIFSALLAGSSPLY